MKKKGEERREGNVSRGGGGSEHGVCLGSDSGVVEMEEVESISGRCVEALINQKRINSNEPNPQLDHAVFRRVRIESSDGSAKTNPLHKTGNVTNQWSGQDRSGDVNALGII